MNMHFDTLAAAKRIEAAGLPRATAEAVVAEIAEAQIEIADKRDIEALKTSLDHKAEKADISDVKAEIGNMKSDLIKWMVGSDGALLALPVALETFAHSL